MAKKFSFRLYANVMTKGRARIPLEILSKPAEGDIHKYSANAIERVKIGWGNERPLKLEIHMRAEVGFFQVEEVLIPKIQSSPADRKSTRLNSSH